MDYDSVQKKPKSQNLHENWYNSKVNLPNLKKKSYNMHISSGV